MTQKIIHPCTFTLQEKRANCAACLLSSSMRDCHHCQFYTPAPKPESPFTMKDLSTRTHNEVKALYIQGVISQAQYEAYDYIWALLNPSQWTGPYKGLCDDTRHNVQDLINTLPPKQQTTARRLLLEHM